MGSPKKQWVRSKPFTWSASGDQPIDFKEFLGPFLSRYKAPTVASLRLQFKGTISAQTTTIAAEDHCRLWRSFELRDRAGIRFKASGGGMRLINQIEYGRRFQDPAALASATTSTYEQYMRIPFESPQNEFPEETRIALEELLDGCDTLLSWSSADPLTHFNITSGTLVVFAEVVEEETRKAKVRHVWTELPATLAEDTYLVNGGLRAAAMYASNSDANGSWYDFSATTDYDFIESQSLEFTRRPRTLIVDEWTQRHDAPLHAAVATTVVDMIRAGKALPIFMGWDRGDKCSLKDLPEQARLHVKLDAAPPASPATKLVVSAVTDRVPSSTAQVLQLGDAANLGNVGIVVDTPRGPRSPSDFTPAQVARMQVRVG